MLDGKKTEEQGVICIKIRSDGPIMEDLRPELSLGMVMTYFESSWNGMTQRGKFKDRRCTLLFNLHVLPS